MKRLCVRMLSFATAGAFIVGAGFVTVPASYGEELGSSSHNVSQVTAGEFLDPDVAESQTAADIVTPVGRGEETGIYRVYRKPSGRYAVQEEPVVGRHEARRVANDMLDQSGTLGVGVAEKVHALKTMNDPYYTGGEQWGLGVLNTAGLWDSSLGEGAEVAVVDSGVQSNHPDLASNVIAAYDFTGSGSGEDGNGHGTHVSGIVAAVGDNGVGTVGVAPKAKISSYRVLDSNGSGTWADVAEGVVAVVNNGTADAINMSLGGSYADPGLQSAIRLAVNANIVVVVAAGNERESGSPTLYPAAFPEVIAVASADSATTDSWFSNIGSYVDVTAPGGSILSTYTGSSYEYLSGTSMASPHVAGVVATIRSAVPSSTVEQIRSALESTATDMLTAGRDDNTGYGMVNPTAALQKVAEENGGIVTPTPTSSPTPSPTSDPIPDPTPTVSPPVNVPQSVQVVFPSPFRHGKRLTLPSVTDQGSDTTWKSKTLRTCVVKKEYKLVAKRKGACRLKVSATAVPGFEAYQGKFSVRIA